MDAKATKKEDQWLAAVDGLVGHNGQTSEEDLQAAGKKMFGGKWGGVWAADEPLKVSARRPFGVMNISPRVSGGSHWVAMVWMKDGHPLLSDSFSRPLSSVAPGRGFHTMGHVGHPHQLVREKNCGQRSLATLALYATHPDLARHL